MKIKIISRLIYYFVRLLNITYRFEYIGFDKRDAYLSEHSKKTFVYAFWHQNIVAVLLAHLKFKQLFTAIISGSKDGELIAQVFNLIGHLPARGSSTRGGKQAMTEMINNINNGYPGAITVDGPLGPAKKVKLGIVNIAKITDVPIFPITAYPEKYWELRSWDKFRIPKPFSKIVVIVGDPMRVDPSITHEEIGLMASEIELKINQCEKIAKKHL